MSETIRKFIAELKPSYDSGFGDNLGKEFYSPCLENCKEYKRMTGEFRSSVIFDWGKALLKILDNSNDKCMVKIIANPSLNSFDAEALKKTLNDSSEIDPFDKIYKDAQSLVNKDLDKKDEREVKLKIFSYLIYKKKLILKFAFPNHVPRPGMFHVKKGIFYFDEGLKVGFNGGPNESHGGHELNIEGIDVFTNLNGNNPHIEDSEMKFDLAWNDKAPGFKTKPLSKKTLEKIKLEAPNTRQELDQIIKKAFDKKKDTLGDLLDDKQIEKLKGLSFSNSLNENKKEDYLVVTEKKWEFQKKAREIFIDKKWGLLEMATGTGKTRTALAIATQLINEKKINKIIVQMKGTDLIRQWRQNINQWTRSKVSEPINVLELSSDRNELDSFLLGFNLPEVDLLLIRQSNLPDLLNKLAKKNLSKTLIIHDEVHDLFAEQISQQVIGKQDGFGFKLGLSATIREPFNLEREKTLFKEIQGGGDQPIFSYNLIQAIKDGVLVESSLIPLSYKLYEDEKAKIKSAYTRYKGRMEEGWLKHKAEAQRNIEISDVRKNARNKLEVFESNINYLKDKLKRSFIFADETDYGKDILNILIPHINVKTHFQDADKKNLENFSNSKIDCIINVLKLSQGIDIQNLNTIVLFATPTGRQFIQRIGRVLRKDKDNPNKKAIIVDFFDEDDLKNENEESSDYRRYLELKKITEARYELR
jgi:superfamily II DNA or RNA helicase